MHAEIMLSRSCRAYYLSKVGEHYVLYHLHELASMHCMTIDHQFEEMDAVKHNYYVGYN